MTLLGIAVSRDGLAHSCDIPFRDDAFSKYNFIVMFSLQSE